MGAETVVDASVAIVDVGAALASPSTIVRPPQLCKLGIVPIDYLGIVPSSHLWHKLRVREDDVEHRTFHLFIYQSKRIRVLPYLDFLNDELAQIFFKEAVELFA